MISAKHSDRREYIKKSICMFMCVVMIVCCFVPSYAAETGMPSASDAMYACFSALAQSVDLTPYSLDTEQVFGLYEHTYNNHPELFYLSVRYSYSQNDSGYVTKLIPEYTMTAEEVMGARTYIGQRLDEIISLSGFYTSDIEKILYFHDYICLNFTYDKSYSVFDIYNFLKSGTGVCQAYTGLYMLLLRRSGIEAGAAASSAMNHIWNVVKLEDMWYNVDVTWDDADRFGYVGHKNFLLSDRQLAMTTEHHDWKSDVECVSDKYADFFGKSDRAFVRCGDEWFYVDNDASERGIYKADLTSAASEEVYKFTEVWYTKENPNKYYLSSYSGIGVYRSMILFSVPEAIMGFDPVSGAVVRIAGIPGTGEGTYIYGFTQNGNILTCALASSPDGMSDGSAVMTLYEITDESVTYMTGDVNGDGYVNGRDITYLALFVGGHGCPLSSVSAADIDCNGNIDENDLSQLRKTVVALYCGS